MTTHGKRLRTPLVHASALFGLVVVAVLGGLRPAVPSEVPAAPNYKDESAWLCRPGRSDVCATPTTATVFEDGGHPETVTYKPDPAAPIDCFYVYPTVSYADSDNAPIAATEREIGAARLQFARFATVCRPFAPLYRQVTRQGLGKIIDNPDPDVAPRKVAYGDVLAAWHAYLVRDNGGRGVVLIGHSQGAKILARLMAAEIDGKPIRARLVAAILPGTKVDVPDGKPVGGTFQHIPLCAHPTPGCVIAYSTYPTDKAVPADARFGETHTPGMIYACVDPAAVAGTATLAADLPMTPELRETYGTDFAEVPSILTAACRRDGRFSVLEVAAKPEGPVGERTAAMLAKIAGYAPSWGLHELDVNVAEGTLVDIVRRQAAAYARK